MRGNHFLLQRLVALLVMLLAANACAWAQAGAGKIAGVSVVEAKGRPHADWTPAAKAIGAEWAAVLPYAIAQQGQPGLIFDVGHKWLPTFAFYREQVRQARRGGLHVMLKPMVWVMGSWAGGYDLAQESEWLQWESRYRSYILQLADMAAAEGVEIFCIGTELAVAARKRPAFFKALIAEVRQHFKGQLTYAANWDEFLTVGFWGELDYIGIDAYFPLVDAKTPSVSALKSAWARHLRRMQPVYLRHKKPILFTEFGYRSIDNCCWEQWLTENLPHDQAVNLNGQGNAYQAFFETFWDQPWFAGAFLWQWYTDHGAAGGPKNSDFTPQNKPAATTIQSWFTKNG